MFTVSYTGGGKQNEGGSSECARSPGKFFKIVESVGRDPLALPNFWYEDTYSSCHLLNHVPSEPWLDKETISNFSNYFPINLIATLWLRISSNMEEKFTQLSLLPILNHSKLFRPQLFSQHPLSPNFRIKLYHPETGYRPRAGTRNTWSRDYGGGQEGRNGWIHLCFRAYF